MGNEKPQQTVDIKVPILPRPDHKPALGPGETLHVTPIPAVVARMPIERHHYLHAFPGGTRLCLGVFVGTELQGVVVLGVGPRMAHRLVRGASPEDGLTLTRLWLADALPTNSESWTIGQTIRFLRRHTTVKFLLSYADPAAGHVGTIYQASNFLYIGLSQAQPALDLGDGVPRHTRSVGSALGTYSTKYLRAQGVVARRIAGNAKHRYLLFVDRRWRHRLAVPVRPFPKK